MPETVRFVDDDACGLLDDADTIAVGFHEARTPTRGRTNIQHWKLSMADFGCDKCWPEHRRRPVLDSECGHDQRPGCRLNRCCSSFDIDHRKKAAPLKVDKSDEIDALYRQIEERRAAVRRAQQAAEALRIEASDARARSSTLVQHCLAVILTRPKLHRALCNADIVSNIPVPPMPPVRPTTADDAIKLRRCRSGPPKRRR
jgi:hypothetical protein